MMKISSVAEIINNNPEEKICTVLLYAVASEEGKETGRFVLDMRVLTEMEYEVNIDPEKLALEHHYLKAWEKEVLEPLSEAIEALKKDSLKTKKIIL